MKQSIIMMIPPIIEGTAEAGSTVNLLIDDEKIYEQQQQMTSVSFLLQHPH